MKRIAVLFAFGVVSLHGQTSDANAPLDWQQRWDGYLERTYSWKRIGVVAAETAFDQTFQFRKCGRPPYCFPHQFGGALARRTTRTTIELGAGALLHEDIRRRPSGLTGVRRRAMFALIHAPLAKSSEGEWRPAYSRFAGTLGAAFVISAWEGNPITFSRISERAGWSATSYFQDALFTEFEPDLKRFGRRVFTKYFGRRDGVSPNSTLK